MHGQMNAKSIVESMVEKEECVRLRRLGGVKPFLGAKMKLVQNCSPGFPELRTFYKVQKFQAVFELSHFSFQCLHYIDRESGTSKGNISKLRKTPKSK